MVSRTGIFGSEHQPILGSHSVHPSGELTGAKKAPPSVAPLQAARQGGVCPERSERAQRPQAATALIRQGPVQVRGRRQKPDAPDVIDTGAGAARGPGTTCPRRKARGQSPSPNREAEALFWYPRAGSPGSSVRLVSAGPAADSVRGLDTIRGADLLGGSAPIQLPTGCDWPQSRRARLGPPAAGR